MSGETPSGPRRGDQAPDLSPAPEESTKDNPVGPRQTPFWGPGMNALRCVRTRCTLFCWGVSQRSSPTLCASPWQAVKQDLSEVFAVYLTFAAELEEQSKQLLEKLERAACSLQSHYGGEVQSEYLRMSLLKEWLTHSCKINLNASPQWIKSCYLQPPVTPKGIKW